MFNASTRSLKILSAIIWTIGCLVLVVKGVRLLIEADHLRPGLAWPWLAIGAGVLIGVLKARLVFDGFCRQNLARIDALKHPQLWQCFRPRFFALLSTMILAGAVLSRLAHAYFAALITLAIIDISIATALAVSSRQFWTGDG